MTHNIVAIRIDNLYRLHNNAVLSVKLFECIRLNSNTGNAVAAAADTGQFHTGRSNSMIIGKNTCFNQLIKAL